MLRLHKKFAGNAQFLEIALQRRRQNDGRQNDAELQRREDAERMQNHLKKGHVGLHKKFARNAQFLEIALRRIAEKHSAKGKD